MALRPITVLNCLKCSRSLSHLLSLAITILHSVTKMSEIILFRDPEVKLSI